MGNIKEKMECIELSLERLTKPDDEKSEERWNRIGIGEYRKIQILFGRKAETEPRNPRILPTGRVA